MSIWCALDTKTSQELSQQPTTVLGFFQKDELMEAKRENE